MGEARREGVELLLTQLAQLCVKKKKVEDAPALPVVAASETSPVATAAATVAPSPAATQMAETDPGAELDRLLGSALQDQNGTARARVLFAKAELARLRRQPAEEEKNIEKIAEFSSEDLSPLLLGQAG